MARMALKINGENDSLTVFIVAGSAIMRAGLESVLQNNEDFAVTGSAADISAAPFDFLVGQTADVILVNVEREQDFSELLVALNGNPEELESPAIVALLPPELQSQEYFTKALQSGVRGILPNDASTNEIMAAVTSAANGLVSLLPEMLEEIFSATTNGTTNEWNTASENDKQNFPSDDLIEALTPREAEILEMLGEGASNKSIAYQLDISEHTVKFHVASIFAKLGVNTRTEAVTRALRRGLILL